jgi:hypothetical protein
MLRYALAFLILFFISPAFFSCNSIRQNEKGVDASMNQYNHYIQKMNLDSLALLFTPDGDLGNIAHGRDSIKAFLSKFKDFKVLSQKSITNSIKIGRDSAVQQGNYFQTTIIPKNDTVKVSGTFTATWIHSNSGWHLKRMLTKPVQ